MFFWVLLDSQDSGLNLILARNKHFRADAMAVFGSELTVTFVASGIIKLTVREFYTVIMEESADCYFYPFNIPETFIHKCRTP